MIKVFWVTKYNLNGITRIKAQPKVSVAFIGLLHLQNFKTRNLPKDASMQMHIM